ncbi:glycerol-3-phosphate dehydrogenase/oxidase [Peribacillus asahii]|uniref:glycerol-3-phosphate dehydrogenase/oxidase n=1 Tax=Peribacillus asahii TaxID=228899 RepID=UPI00381B12DB
MAQTYMNRLQLLQKMSEKQYDLLIIGGGITGAGIALDAVTRGMEVGLLEMQDFAAGTSSRSSKLIHGGLRYLKQGEVKLVAEVGKERAIVYENGPHVTKPEWMLLPVYKDGELGPRSISMGLKVYDFLAAVKKQERRRMLSKEQVVKQEPLLKRQGLQGGGYYVEYRTDDARLTIEVIKRAAEFGADLLNYTKVIDFLYEDRKVAGVVVEDIQTGSRYDIRAKKVVNATGAWIDSLREKDGSNEGKTLKLTKGVHVVIDQSRFPLKQAIYFDTEDNRMVFAIPREGKVYVGTTDTFYDKDPIRPLITEEDRRYILKAIHFIFPKLTLSAQDIESSWAGVRPLIHEEGKGPSEISRKDEIWVSKSGLITIAGGKLTGYRKMAETIVNLLSRQFKDEQYKLFGKCVTKKLPISGGDVGGSHYFEAYISKYTKEGIKLGLTECEARYLTRLYGSNISKIYQIIRDGKNDIEKYQFTPEVFAKLVYGIQEEYVVTPVDFFVRRTSALLFQIDWVHRWKEAVSRYMCDVFGWSETETLKYKAELEQEIWNATNVSDV